MIAARRLSGWKRFAALVALLALAAPVGAEEQGRPSYDPREAHRETDTNGDGKVDRSEFHERMVEVFFFGDADRDGYMSWDELGRSVVFPDDFRNADRDDDGRISLYEFIEVRFHDFHAVDENGDGLLSEEEVVVVFQRGGVR